MLPPPDRLLRDLQRDVHCLFGLPVDNLTMAQTKALLRERCTQEGNTVLATINVNWVAESFRDPTFRDAIINSDLVVLDGKPLLWLARLFGCPMRETVPGSTLIQDLLEEPSDQPLTIFLFGGEGDAAERAMQRINGRENGGLRAVGALNPGFGKVEEMSTEAIIATINNTQPDILLVALGAKKGTQWIEYNRDRMNAKIISHLGATINFLAGTVKRAPKIFRTLGLEWVWRIVQEPKLFSRYAADGWTVLRFLFPRLLSWWQCHNQRKQIGCKQTEAEAVSIRDHPDSILVSFGCNLQITNNAQFRHLFTRCAHLNKRIILNFQKTKYVDSAFLGLLLLLQRRQKVKNREVVLTNCNNRIITLFQLFNIRNNNHNE